MRGVKYNMLLYVTRPIFNQRPTVKRTSMLSKFILRIILMTNIGIESVVEAKQGLANRLTGAYHRLQDSDRYSADDRADRALSIKLMTCNKQKGSLIYTSFPDRS